MAMGYYPRCEMCGLGLDEHEQPCSYNAEQAAREQERRREVAAERKRLDLDAPREGQ